MLTRFIVAVVRVCTRHAWLTVAAAVLLAGASGYYTAHHFAISTDINKLISPDLSWRKREIAFEKTFPGRNDLILAVVEAPTPELAREAGLNLEKVLAPQKDKFLAADIPGGGPFFDANGLLFLPTEDVAKLTAQLTSASPIFDILIDDPNLRGLTGVLEFGLNGAERNQYPKEALARPLTTVADTVEKAMGDGPASFSWREISSPAPLTPADRRMLLTLRPVLDFNALEPGKVATDAIRKAAKDLDLAGKYQADVRLTGPVPIANEEFGTVQDGALVNTLGTVVVVLFILWLALHSPKIIISVFITIAIGLSVTTAAGLMLVGALNLISIAFAVLFVGIGVDFGIQYSVRYRAERFNTGDLHQAIEVAADHSAVPLTLAAIATAAGFLSFLPTSYEGVSELGKIAGAGMIIAYVAALTVLPALLTLLNPPGESEPLGYSFLAPVDRFLEQHRVAIVATTLGVAVAGLPLLYFLQFDFNPMNLRSKKMESIATYLDLRKDPKSGTNAVETIAASEADAKALQDKLDKLPEVARTISLDTFVPPDQQAKLGLIHKAAATLDPILAGEAGDPPSDTDRVVALNEAAQSLRKSAGKTAAPWADACRRLADDLTKLAKADAALRDKVEATMITPLSIMLDQIRSMLKAQPVSLKTLPPEIAGEWSKPDGRVRVQAQPSGDPNDNDTLRKFAAAVLKVDPGATGGPISILESGDTIVSAFIQAGCWALLSISILLWIVLRRIGDVLLTLVPLLLAGVVTLEICVLIGLPLNFANIIALPLLLGIGVAFKIYYVTAWRAGQTDLLQSSLTRAIFFSAMTTATAFGSLWLSSHPGTSSMGKLMALSLVTTLAAAVLFQPALMGRPRDLGE
ncbi:MAG: MMPL family transporter [Xanthobacteraceae bacterium]|nr:MMPL family transporter [Xanthobacteraceae bacterium]